MAQYGCPPVLHMGAVDYPMLAVEMAIWSGMIAIINSGGDFEAFKHVFRDGVLKAFTMNPPKSPPSNQFEDLPSDDDMDVDIPDNEDGHDVSPDATDFQAAISAMAADSDRRVAQLQQQYQAQLRHKVSTTTAALQTVLQESGINDARIQEVLSAFQEPGSKIVSIHTTSLPYSDVPQYLIFLIQMSPYIPKRADEGLTESAGHSSTHPSPPTTSRSSGSQLLQSSLTNNTISSSSQVDVAVHIMTTQRRKSRSHPLFSVYLNICANN